MIQPSLLETKPVPPPALEQARRRLDDLQRDHDSALAEAQESGSDGEMQQTREWKALTASLTRARETVTALEADAVKWGSR